MSSPFLKRSKPRPPTRQRSPTSISSPLAGPSVTAVEDEDTGESPMALMKSRKREKEKKRLGGLGGSSTGGKARLSFGGEEEEMDEESITFKPRKSQLSQALSLQKLALSASTSSLPPSTPSASQTYSTSYLNSLKASTPTRGSSSRSAIDLDGPDPDDFSDGYSRAARDKYGAALDAGGGDTTEGIPDEAFVAAAKAKRKARFGAPAEEEEEKGGEDYISLGEGRGRVAVYDGDKGPHPESRLQREDDEEGEGDEDMADYTEANTNLPLGKSANRAAARRLKTDILEMIDDKENEESDNEDEKEWERAQAFRAGGREERVVERVVEKKKGRKPAFTPHPRPLPTLSTTISRLTTSLSLMESSLSTRESAIEANQRELKALEEQEGDLRREVERVERKKEGSEEFGGWVEVVGGFLGEKFPKLEDIEADTRHHYQERAQLITQRRKEDDMDDLSLFLGVAVSPDDDPEAVEVDELGRERRKADEAGPHSGIRKQRRFARSSRRSARRSKHSGKEEEDGFSTDSTLSPSDAHDYSAAQQALTERVKALAADVAAEEFRDPELGLLRRFRKWREEDGEGYGSCYGGASMVQGWEYWARVEMVGWEPSRDPIEPHSFKWYQSLHSYSHVPAVPGEDTNMDSEDDDDLELGPEGDLAHAMLSAAVAPLIGKYVEAGGYDLYSRGQTGRMVELVGGIGEVVGRENLKYKAMLKSILTSFLAELSTLTTLITTTTHPSSLPPPAFDPASRTALSTFINRRIKLVRNILAWRRAAKDEVGVLVGKWGEGVGEVVGRCWESGGREMGLKVIQAVGAQNLPPQLVQVLSTGNVRR